MFYFLISDKSPERVQKVTDTVVKLQNLADSLMRLSIDQTEFAFLKILTLFSPGTDV
jgi:hypothetical protein